jgi:hypothetical protein
MMSDRRRLGDVCDRIVRARTVGGGIQIRLVGGLAAGLVESRI